MSSKSATNSNKIGLAVSDIGLWLGAALAVGLFYLAVSAWLFGFSGFPLDDAWIHQTYARNLAYSGQMAFVPDRTSAGSTAPLWSFLLSLGYLLRIPFQIWTYGLGIILLALTGWTVSRLGRELFPKSRNIGLWAGLFSVFEWHLVWSAVSGMETILFIWLSLFLFWHYRRSGSGKLYNFSLGAIGGLLILTRPEGLGLVGLIGLDIAYSRLPNLLRRWLWIIIGVGCFIVPYAAFNLLVAGTPFPNSFYAKQVEYGVVMELYPLWYRLFGGFGTPVESVQGVFRVIFIGTQLLLLPGLFYGGWLTYKEGRLELIPVWLWWISYLMLYAVKLPVTYQHGRYQIPVIVWVILLGVWGTARLLELRKTVHAGQSVRLILRVAGSVFPLSLLLLVLSFTVIGAWTYSRDVRFIESEMVATAVWLNENTEADVIIATHDIGAVGYFTQRPLIDLAGLITPEIIPIIRDEAALFDFIRLHKTEYLMSFPSWYPELTKNKLLTPIYSSQGSRSEDNMTVYQIADAQ